MSRARNRTRLFSHKRPRPSSPPLRAATALHWPDTGRTVVRVTVALPPPEVTYTRAARCAP